MIRTLAVDWGERRVGVAISDPTGFLARALPTVVVRDENDAVDRLVALAESEEAGELVVGLPLNMDGTRGAAAESAARLAERLGERTGLPVHLWDERLTSVQAERIDREHGTRRRRDKGAIDARAAEILLQSFLDGRRLRGGTG